MDTTIGTSQTSVVITSVADTNSHNYYFTRFASQPLYQSSLAANTWTYNFATKESNGLANFPETSNNKSVRVTCYVWRPSNSSLVGWILDGNSAATVDEGLAGLEIGHHVTFSGSAVSGVQAGDVIIFEVMFVIVQGAATAYDDTFYFDGTTANTTDNSSPSNHASFLETPETLVLVPGQAVEKALTTETVNVQESLDRIALHNKSKTLTTETVTLTESAAPARLGTKQRALTTETVLLVEVTKVRLAAKLRPVTTETISVAENVAGEVTGGGPHNVEKSMTTETTTLTEQSFNRQAAKWRKISRPL